MSSKEKQNSSVEMLIPLWTLRSLKKISKVTKQVNGKRSFISHGFGRVGAFTAIKNTKT